MRDSSTHLSLLPALVLLRCILVGAGTHYLLEEVEVIWKVWSPSSSPQFNQKPQEAHMRRRAFRGVGEEPGSKACDLWTLEFMGAVAFTCDTLGAWAGQMT